MCESVTPLLLAVSMSKGVCVPVDATSGLCGSHERTKPLWFFADTHIQYDTHTHTHTCRCWCCYFAFISCLKVQKKKKKTQPAGKYVMLSFEKLSKGKKRVETPRHEFPQMVITALTASWCMWISVERLRRASLCSVCVCVEHVHAFVAVSFSFLWRISLRFPLLGCMRFRGLKGDATECKSNFKIKYIKRVWRRHRFSRTRTKMFSRFFFFFFLSFFRSTLRRSLFPFYSAKIKEKKTRDSCNNIFVMTSIHVHKNPFFAS